MNFHFDVAFNEPKIIDTKPLIVPLHQITQLVGKVILDFDVLLA